MQSTEQLTDLIRNKHRVLVQLREIGRRQIDLVAGGEIASLLTLLGGKQQLIAGLQALETHLKPYYAQNPDTRAWRSAEERAECAKLVSECNAILEEIVSLEKLSAEKMNARKTEVAEQLQQAHGATHVRNAYQAQRRAHA